MMDGRSLYDEPFHPVHQTHSIDGNRLVYPKYLRSQKPVRYYYIDFGYASWFRGANDPRTVVGSRARERAPEQTGGNPYDPFKADIYQLGAVIRRDLIPVRPELKTHSLLISACIEIRPLGVPPPTCSRDD